MSRVFYVFIGLSCLSWARRVVTSSGSREDTKCGRWKILQALSLLEKTDHLSHARNFLMELIPKSFVMPSQALATLMLTSRPRSILAAASSRSRASNRQNSRFRMLMQIGTEKQPLKLSDGTGPFRFNSRRAPVYGSRGMVASSQPLASQAGLQILQAGGTAADACVAAAAALNVAEPCSTGIGGDAFALFYNASTKQVECLQGCGRSPAGLTLDAVRAHPEMVGRSELPALSALTVTVPGAAAAWESAVEKWGQLRLAEVLQPAIELAEEGLPLQPAVARAFADGAGQLRYGARGKSTPFLPEGRIPRAGEIFRNPELGKTFRLLGEKGAKDGFYRGEVAQAIVDACIERGGVLEMEDLDAHATSFPEPISSSYRGKVRLWECPPPSQGITALMALDLVENEPASSPLSFESVHAQAEALRFAFADTLRWCSDPEAAEFPGCSSLLCKEQARNDWKSKFSKKRRASGITPKDTIELRTGPDTVYLCAVDKWGNACSFINSNYMGFGTGIVPEGCGFTLQNRGHNFIIREGHPNCLGPRKFCYHTIIPALATHEGSGEFFCAMGVMGGFMQPQGHLQVLAAMVDHNFDPQAALDQPRFSVNGVSSELGPESVEDATLLLEEGIPEEVCRKLQDAGHRTFVVRGWDREVFGRGQIICRDPETGVMYGGTEPRADGGIAVW